MISLTANQAYLAMFKFLEEHYRQTASDDVGALLGSMSLLSDGAPADGALEQQWKTAIQAAVDGEVDAAFRLGQPAKDQ